MNHTAWPSQYFQHVDPHGDIFHVMVTRITYSLKRLVATDGPLMAPEIFPPGEHPPLCEADQFAGGDNATTLVQESDYAPYKPKCDVLLSNASAWVPGDKPMDRWPAGFRFGSAIQKTFHVTGPRIFRRTLAALGGLDVGDPEPAMSVPLRYELAFGGPNLVAHDGALQAHVDGEDAADLTETERDRRRIAASKALAALPDYYAPNPIGCGREPQAITKADTALADVDAIGRPAATRPAPAVRPAPQIEAFDRPYRGQTDYPVVGIGPVGRWWSPRVALAGTHDEAWKRSQWPRSPLDHHYRYWNCAPEDQQIDYPQGGEEIVLAHLTPSQHNTQPVRFALPRQDLQLLMRLHVGAVLFAPMNIDTVILDFRAGTLAIVRRAVVSARAGVRQLELGTWPAGTALELDDDMRRQAEARKTTQKRKEHPHG
ncbi:DUF2169 domain-containing protein [Sphingomonas sp. NCPPB 2930]